MLRLTCLAGCMSVVLVLAANPAVAQSPDCCTGTGTVVNTGVIIEGTPIITDTPVIEGAPVVECTPVATTSGILNNGRFLERVPRPGLFDGSAFNGNGPLNRFGRTTVTTSYTSPEGLVCCTPTRTSRLGLLRRSR